MNFLTDPNRTYPEGSQIDYWEAEDGWKIRRFRYGQQDKQAARGSILFAGGRGDFFEKNLEAFLHWHAEGWNIESFDWRGQGGSGRNSEGSNLGHVQDFAIWMKDYAAYYAQWEQANPGPHIIMGHSMGGHLMTRALGEGIATPDAAVLIAPMLGFKSFVPNVVGQKAAQLMTMVASPEGAGWKYSEKPGAHENQRASLLTHDKKRYEDEPFGREENEVLGLGPGTWQWIKAAYESMMITATPEFLGRIKLPVLILSARADKLVDPMAAVRAAKLLPDATLHVYGPESAHEILREADPVRNDALKRIDDFLETKAPVKAA